MRSTRITHLSIPVLLAIVTLAACGSSSDTQASLTEAPTTNPTTTAAVTTTAAETTTTTEAVTTTVAVTIAGPTLTAADLVLSAAGIGPLMFGDAGDSTIAALASALGTPTEDTTHEYTISCSSSDACNGYTDGYTDEDGFLTFGYPIGRSVCFGNGLCAIFGGSTSDELPFVGWSLSRLREVGDNSPGLLTATGMTLGSVWADFEDVMSVWGGCYVTAYGETSGVQLQLSATTGELFAPTFFETDSTEVFVQPGPEVMVVDVLSAGEDTRSIIGDCPG